MADKELTFWDHLDELRRVLFRVLGVWFVLAVGYFIAMPWLFDNVVLAPCHNDFVFYDVLRYVGKVFDLHDDFFTQEFHVKLININLAAPFFIHMSTAFWMSVVTATPYIFFEIWRFISPALYANERRGVKKALCIGTVMFFLGVLLGYFMVYPLTLRFLHGNVRQLVFLLQELYHPLFGKFVARVGLLRGSLADLLCILFIVLGEVADECFLLFLQSQECVPDFFRQCVTVHVHHACVVHGDGRTYLVQCLVK